MNGKGRKKSSVTQRSPPDLAFDPIDAALRQIHDSIAAEAIPEDFLRLLDQLNGEPAKRSSI